MDESIPRFYYNGKYYNLYRYVRDKANSLDSRWLKDETIPEMIEKYEKKIRDGKDIYYNSAIMNAYKLLAYKRNESYSEAQMFLSDPVVTMQPAQNEVTPEEDNVSVSKQEELPKRSFCRFCGQRFNVAKNSFSCGSAWNSNLRRSWGRNSSKRIL